MGSASVTSVSSPANRLKVSDPPQGGPTGLPPAKTSCKDEKPSLNGIWLLHYPPAALFLPRYVLYYILHHRKNYDDLQNISKEKIRDNYVMEQNHEALLQYREEEEEEEEEDPAG